MKFVPDILKSLRDTYANRHEPESLGVLAGIYWRTVLGVALLLLVIIVSYSMWNLVRILHSLGVIPTPSPLPPPALNRTLLNTTLEVLDARKAQFDALKVNPSSSISDPSK